MNIWVPKLKIIEAELVAPVGGVEGFFMVECLNRYGRVTRRLGPWKQLITNQTMDDFFYMNNSGSTSGPHAQCRVGTSSPTFTNASTGLGTPIATSSSTSAFSNTIDTTGTSPINYRERHTATADFTLGSVVGNLNEVGFFRGFLTTDGAFLDLTRDVGGTPTTFPVTSSDQLRVTHIFDRYPFLGTTGANFTIGGAAGSGVHAYTSSMGNLSTDGSGGSLDGHVFGVANNSAQSWNLQAFKSVSALGAITAQLTGAVALGSAVTGSSGLGTASNDLTTWTRSNTFTFGLTIANDLAGISGFSYGQLASRALKFFISPAIPKFASSIQRVLTINASYGFIRI